VFLAGERPDRSLSASILPIIEMLTVFAFATGAGAAAPAFDPPHADAETATPPTMSATANIFRGLSLLESKRFTIFTPSGWVGRSYPGRERRPEPAPGCSKGSFVESGQMRHRDLPHL